LVKWSRRPKPSARPSPPVVPPPGPPPQFRP
jgi:hypothetical protein